jgi:hypothetical protein
MVSIYPSIHLSLFQCYTGHWFSVAFRHIYLFTASSGVRVFRFTTVSFPFLSSFRISVYFLFPSAIGSILFEAICNLPCKILVLVILTFYFPFFPELFVLLSFLIITSFLILIFWMFFQLFSKNQFLYYTTSYALCNPLSTFHNGSLKCVKYSFLYLIKYVYSKMNNLMFFLHSWLAQFCFNTPSLHFNEYVKMDSKYLSALC